MEWIDLDERRPPPGIPVLVAKFDDRPKFKCYFVHIASRYHDFWYEGENQKNLENKDAFITHWMPLPEPPEKPKECA